MGPDGEPFGVKLTRGIISSATGVAPASSTWNPADKNAGISLTGGNLIATRASSSPANAEVVRATSSKSSGKSYWECTPSGTTGLGNVSIGLAVAGASLAAAIGIDTNGVGYFDGGNVRMNTTAIGNAGSYTTADVIGIAIDLGAQLIWFRKNGGVWNNSGANNPSTGVGGFSYSGITAGALFPAISLNVSVPTSGTANFGASAFGASAPAGFSAWG